jgi:hypothetical protein
MRIAMRRMSFLRSLGLASLGLASGVLVDRQTRYVETGSRGAIKVTDFGAIGDGATNDALAIQGAIDNLPGGKGAIYFPAGNYNCTSDLNYALNSRGHSGSIVFHGDGKDTSTLWLNGANLNDGQYHDWNTGYTWLIISGMTLRFTGNGMKGLWQARTTLPELSDVTLLLDGIFPDNSTVLLGFGPGPVGQTAVWRDVELTINTHGGNYVTYLHPHFDTFYWLGGGINTFIGSACIDPRLLIIDPVYTMVFDSISMFRGDKVSAKMALVGVPYDGHIEFTRCHFANYFSSHFYNYSGSKTAPTIIIRNCHADTWPLVLGGSPPPVLIFEDNLNYVNRNAGTASVANGDTISHGLASAPTKYGVTGTVAGHIATVTDVNATMLTIGLTSYDGSPVTSSEKVAWWAEF